jgi:predicted nuclease of predicted toxin-antitoxin system
VKYLVDAQLPSKLSRMLHAYGLDSLHTDDLPRRERTDDETIIRIADREQRIVITKDADFLDSYLVRGSPSKFLFVTTGNIPNSALLQLFEQNIEMINNLFEQHTFLELSNTTLIVHE